MATTTAANAASAVPPVDARRGYLTALAALFAVFNTMRVAAYLPTIWTIAATGESSQHSLWTWVIFLGSNATMTAWLWEQRERRCDRVVAANAGNTLMCMGVVLVIGWTRI